MFQIGIADVLPWILHKFGKSGGCSSFFRTIVVIFVWSFPYIIATVPFYFYFFPDRSQWMKKYGFKGTDIKEDLQYKIRNYLYLLTFFYLAFVISVYFYLRNMDKDKGK